MSIVAILIVIILVLLVIYLARRVMGPEPALVCGSGRVVSSRRILATAIGRK
jgi:hypothetical protein